MKKLSIEEIIKCADSGPTNPNTGVMVNLDELKRLVRRAEMLNFFTSEEVSAAFRRYTAPAPKGA